MKKITSLAMVLVLLLTATIPAKAALPETTVSPYFINTSQASVSLGISEDGVAGWTIACFGESGCTGIAAVSYLERKVGTQWERVDLVISYDEFTISTTGKELVKTYRNPVTIRGEYRAVVEFTVYGATGNDEITLWSYADY